MKRKSLLAFFLIVAALACAFSLAACAEKSNNGNNPDDGSGNDAPPPHTHTWSQTWENDDAHHWHNCTVSGCSEKNGYADHDFTYGECVCGKKMPTDAHTHTWSEDWGQNDTHHWHNCTANGCDITDVSQKNGYADHDFTNGECVCGKKMPTATHTHTWSEDWGQNDTHHWHNCTASGCDITDVSQKNGYAEHDFTNGDCVCGKKIPEYNVTFVHNYSGSTDTVKSTVNGLINYIPVRDGYIFNGWWYSDGKIGDNKYMLSEKFNMAQRITQSDVTLYAEWLPERTSELQLHSPIVSISENGMFNWNAVTNAQNYKVEVFSNSTKVIDQTLTSTYWMFPDNKASGYYTIKIRANGDGETTVSSAWTEKYYLHHILKAAVPSFNNSTSMLTWDTVENADAYEVRINNVLKATVTNTSYDLSDLEAGNYTITVTPSRSGWSSSATTSQSINKKRLKTPSVTLIENNDGTYTISWSAVAHANTYRIKHHNTYINVTGTSYTINNDSPIFNTDGFGEFTVVSFDSNADYFISGDSESLQIEKLYLPSLTKSDNSAGSVSPAKQTYKAGESVTISATTNRGYTWLGWYDNEQRLTSELSYTFTMSSENKTHTAKWKVNNELSNFNFTSTPTTLCITGIKNRNVTDIYVPEYVTSIDRYAFRNCDSLTSITLPFVGASKDGTYNTHFGYIFGANEYSYNDNYVPISLKTVVISDGTSISKNAFYECGNLTSLSLPNGIESIGIDAFYECRNLTSITYTSSMKNWCEISGLDNLMKYGKSKTLTIDGKEIIENLIIPDGVTRINTYAFYNCSSLTSVTIPNSVTSIGSNAFSYCSSLTSITLPFVGASKDGTYGTHFGYIFGANGYSYNDSYVPSSLKTVVISGGTIIGEKAFYECRDLTSVTIPDSVTSIGKRAFYGCSSLTSITLPFLGRTKDDITFGALGYIFTDNYSQYRIPESLKTVVISGGTRIQDSAFSRCSSLTSITIPKSVTSVGESVFSDCSSLTSITVESGNTKYKSIGNCLIETASNKLITGCNNSAIPTDGSVTSIDSYAFYGRKSLTSIEIPNSVTSIGDSAFYNCSSLTSIEISNSVESIERSAFDNCYALTIYCETASKPGGWDSEWKMDKCPVVWSCKTNDKDEDGYAYVVDKGIRYSLKDKNATVIQQPSSISGSITILSNITYNSETYSVTSIGSSAFYECRDLTSVTISNSVMNIGYGAFSFCDSLTSITYKGNIENWLNISGIINLMKYGTENKTLNIDGKEITGNLIIPDDVTSIGESAFYNCNSITSITIPNSVTSIGDIAFYKCSSLKNIYFKGTEAQWKAITKGSNWDYNTGNGSYTVHCDDGDIAKS